MEQTELAKILEEHKKWLDVSRPDGIRANLSGANLRGANLSDANLSDADLSDANLSDANLRGANLSDADLSGANLRGANLSDANLSDANLRGANLSDADLRGANLRGANLSDADLRGANLSGANLSDANLSDANLSDANLSRSQGLLSSIAFMARFERDGLGWIVYKAIGNTSYDAPDAWKVEPGEFLTEVVNPSRVDMCGCGVNFADFNWVRENYSHARAIWKCRIRFEDGPGIVVPFNTDGKARCERLELLEIVK